MDSGVRSPRVSKGHSHNAQYPTFLDRECSRNFALPHGPASDTTMHEKELGIRTAGILQQHVES